MVFTGLFQTAYLKTNLDLDHLRFGFPFSVTILNLIFSGTGSTAFETKSPTQDPKVPAKNQFPNINLGKHEIILWNSLNKNDPHRKSQASFCILHFSDILWVTGSVGNWVVIVICGENNAICSNGWCITRLWRWEISVNEFWCVVEQQKLFQVGDRRRGSWSGWNLVVISDIRWEHDNSFMWAIQTRFLMQVIFGRWFAVVVLGEWFSWFCNLRDFDCLPNRP